MLYLRRIFHQDITHQITANRDGSIIFFKYDYTAYPADRDIFFTYKDRGSHPSLDGSVFKGVLHPDSSESRINGDFKSFLISQLGVKESDILLIWNNDRDNTKYILSYVGQLDKDYKVLTSLMGRINHLVSVDEEPDSANKEDSFNSGFPLQQIHYGAPGTGKSNTVKKITSRQPKENVFRTTFHPDSDYSTFVGCYKPTKRPQQQRHNLDELSALLKKALSNTSNATQDCVKFGFDNYLSLKEVGVLEVVKDAGLYTNNNDTHIRAGMSLFEENGSKISGLTYEFVPQVFTNAYVRAYQTDEPVYLVIEEINRGNCAQIFGDIFQLLDRDEEGVSDYAVKPDRDLEQYLIEHVVGYDAHEGMRLPQNLHILATMNTSDQSLFPIDSAFKRRWEWKYVPISNAGKAWKICVNGTEYDWWSFIENINNKIWDATKSEDKKLGYFFCKADRKVNENDEENNVISADRFVGKVLFYVYNDVFKDYGFDDAIFKDKEDNNCDLLFQSYFKANGKPNEEKIEVFLKNLEVKLASEMAEENEDDYIDEPEDEDAGLEENVENNNGVSDTNSPYKVTFPDGEVICEEYGWDTYIATLRKIGLDKALPFGQIFTRMNKTLPLITDKKIPDQGTYKYIKIDGYYVLSGTDSQHRLLRRMNKDLDLGLIIE